MRAFGVFASIARLRVIGDMTMRFLRAIVRVEKGSKSIGVVLAEVCSCTDLRPAPAISSPGHFSPRSSAGLPPRRRIDYPTRFRVIDVRRGGIDARGRKWNRQV